MSESQIQEIQVDIDEARGVVEEAEKLNRLFQNPDFKSLIREGYFKEEAARLVELKASPEMQSPQRQEMVLKAIDAIGGLQQHFNKVWIMAETAQEAIRQGEQEIESALAEELEGSTELDA